MERTSGVHSEQQLMTKDTTRIMTRLYLVQIQTGFGCVSDSGHDIHSEPPGKYL